MENLEQNLNIETKKNKKKKIALVVLICVVALAIVFTSWAFLIQPKFFPTIYWKTYKSEKNGFQVKYPRDYQVKSLGLVAVDWKYNPELSAIYKEGVSFKDRNKHVVFVINVSENPSKFSPRQWMDWTIQDSAMYQDISKSYKDVVIDNMAAIKFDAEYLGQIDSRVILSTDSLVFRIDYAETLQDNKNNKAVFDLFLKSLQVD